MQDRFKFRVWDKENEIWLENGDCSLSMNGELTVLGMDAYGETIFCDSKNYIMEQCTGLKDKNGNPVYEGDIVAEEFLGCIDKHGVVKYGNFNCSCCDGVYGWYIDDGDIRGLEEDCTYCVVTGNIHENADLLGGNIDEKDK